MSSLSLPGKQLTRRDSLSSVAAQAIGAGSAVLLEHGFVMIVNRGFNTELALYILEGPRHFACRVCRSQHAWCLRKEES